MVKVGNVLMAPIRFLCVRRSMYLLVCKIVALVFVSTPFSSWTYADTNSGLGRADEELIRFHERFATPRLVSVSDNVHVAFAYEYSNFSFIEGTDGLIVVDAGFYPGASAKALSDLRQSSDKPIKAIIYTHIHLDHTGGIDAFLDKGASTPPVIYGPALWEPFVRESTSVLMPMVLWRAFAQNGVLLPKGESGAVGAGIGPVPSMAGNSRIAPPSVQIAERTRIEVAGVTLDLIPTPGDIASSHLMVWMPEARVLFAGDILGGTFPYVETSRFELDRDPKGFVESLDLALELEPEYVVPGHGRVLLDSKDVVDVLTANRDVIQYLIDQVERLIAKGYSADQIIDEFELPENLAQHPDLQPHYHRVEWMIRGMYLKRAGFAGNVMDLVTHTESEEALRLVPLMGGEQAVLKASAEALNGSDARWAARLATYVLLTNPENRQAMAVRLAAYRAIAATTNSSNERNRLLTALLRDSGHLDWTAIEVASQQRTYQRLPTAQLLSMFRVRVNPVQAHGKSWRIGVEIKGEDIAHLWTLKNSTLRYSGINRENTDGALRLDRKTLLALYAGADSWSAAIESGLVQASGVAEAFVQVFD